MTKTYLLIDGMNIFFRGIHSVSPSAGIDTMIGMALHIILHSIKKAYNEFGADHIVMCLEGSSFRKNIYPDYKLNRKLSRLKKTEKELEDEKIIMEAFDDLCNYLDKSTNVSVIRCPVAEADDVIAVFTQMHPDDRHIIVSSDQDYYQLINENISIYNGVEQTVINHKGFFKDNKPVIDKKTKAPKPAVDPKYFLFKKIIRGDTSDNIKPAYPGVRENGTKNKVGIREAYEDLDNKGFKWNNFMLQNILDLDGNECKVRDKYLLNTSLIDLTAQPDDIKIKCIDCIMQATDVEPVRANGIGFMRFCKSWGLERISQYPDDFIKPLFSKY
jgi:5'-3' exonuclease